MREEGAANYRQERDRQEHADKYPTQRFKHHLPVVRGAANLEHGAVPQSCGSENEVAFRPLRDSNPGQLARNSA